MNSIEFDPEKTKELIDKDSFLRHAYAQLDGDRLDDLEMVFSTFIKGNEELEKRYKELKKEEKNLFLEFFRSKIEQSDSDLKRKL